MRNTPTLLHKVICKMETCPNAYSLHVQGIADTINSAQYKRHRAALKKAYLETVSDHEKAIHNALTNVHGLTITTQFIRSVYNDKMKNDLYRVELFKDGHKWHEIEFTQSAWLSGGNCGLIPPTLAFVMYGITRNDPDTFENFCRDFGFDTDSRKAESIYKACVADFLAFNRTFSESEQNAINELLHDF